MKHIGAMSLGELEQECLKSEKIILESTDTEEIESEQVHLTQCIGYLDSKLGIILSQLEELDQLISHSEFKQIDAIIMKARVRLVM